MNYVKPINSSDILPKIVGETKHYPPAVKEWTNSVYTYNKKYLKNLPSKDIMASKIIKNYFNLSDCKHLARSRRMRNLIRKSSVYKIYVSKPELKQTNDNIGITIYTLDTEKQLLLRKIYHKIRKQEKIKYRKDISYINVFDKYEYWRNKYNLNKYLNKLENSALYTKNSSKSRVIKSKYLFLKNYINTKNVHLHGNRMHYLKTRSNLYFLRKIRKNIFLKKKLKIKKKLRKNIKKRIIPYFGISSLNETKFLRYVTRSNNNSIQTRRRVFYYYIKRIFFLLGIKFLIFDGLNNNINTIHYLSNSNFKKFKGKILLFFKGESSGISEILSVDSIQENLHYMDKINIVLTSFLNKILNNNNLIKKNKISLALYSKTNFKEFLYNKYLSKNKNKSLVLSKIKLNNFNKEISLIKEYVKLKVNDFKFNKYLPALKLLIGKIYNKKIELNIVKLKYLYLNSDIFAEAISIKLRKKTNLLKVIKKSFNLVKIPEFNQLTNNVNNIRVLDVHKSLKLNNLFIPKYIQNNSADGLDTVINNIYPSSYINQQNTYKNIKYTTNKITSIINVVKYKWVTGIRLDVAGRLTKRYTAARSVFKHRKKGSLKNMDFSRKLDFLKKSMPVVTFRNNAKTNSQYVFTNSKRRIGAFGLKGWLTSS